jgi:adenine-specific DNA-methyltransferase
VSTPRTAVGAVRHRDTRINIPTEELRDFVEADEQAPTVLRYPRDPSLDPQLVWRGKDEQDGADLEVPAVPIYIQEHVHPQALIEDLRRVGRREAEPQLGLFADLNDLPFEQKVEFYQHEQNWANRLILGDSLVVMASLAEKEGLRGKVQAIYIDPPYGIKFNSNWQVSTRKRDVRDGRAEDLTRQPEQIRAFRDTWEVGIHSYLSYLRDRLVAAWDLLTNSGSVFVQIGDENVHLVRSLLDEVFGADNFVVTFVVKKKGGTTPTDPVNDYILWASRDRASLKVRPTFERRRSPGEGSKFTTLIGPDGSRRSLATLGESNVDELLRSGYRYARVDWPLMSQDPSARSRPFVWQGRSCDCAPGNHWRYDPDTQMVKLAIAGRINLDARRPAGIVLWEDWPYETRSNIWDDTGAQQDLTYVVQTPTKVVERCLLMTTDPGDLVLDPTCGSGTTAYVAEQWGRRWITIDTSRVALTLARTRLMAARFAYYLLADSSEGVKKEADLTGLTPPDYRTEGDVKRGFVYKRARRVTLKSIAENPDIREGMTRAEIQASIARHADSELLYDQPYDDAKRARVAGPFTVESLSPHRLVAPDAEGESGTAAVSSDGATTRTGDFVRLILDNLKKAGVQNTVKGERLVFDRLEPYAGEWLHATGEYTETAEGNGAGATRRVAVCIGPEHGTVTPELVKDAAKEAVRGVGFDLLLVCGFAFDPHVSEESRRYGSLTILPTRMNADLLMGDLLKTTGSGNLFMVFGEPDVEIDKGPDGKLTVAIRGLDVYDPTTGEIRSRSTNDIACWFLDTAYNEEAFVVRHAYFTGAGDPYERLRKALRAEIDEAAWASLYATTSRPFDPPVTGKIAMKVINHYGDEVLKVFSVEWAWQ